MAGARDDHSKSDKEGQIPYDITYMWNPKYDTNEHIYATTTGLQRLPRGLGEARTGSLGLIVHDQPNDKCMINYVISA